ncbi:hypothetical protein OAO87_01000 [bacterium]|nr:hypothetical protein [bacterium]
MHYLAFLQLCFSAAFLLVGQSRILTESRRMRLLGFTLVSTCRWACDGWLLMMAFAERGADEASPHEPAHDERPSAPEQLWLCARVWRVRRCSARCSRFLYPRRARSAGMPRRPWLPWGRRGCRGVAVAAAWSPRLPRGRGC